MDILTFIQNNPITACILAYLLGGVVSIIGNAVVASIAAGKQK